MRIDRNDQVPQRHGEVMICDPLRQAVVVVHDEETSGEGFSILTNAIVLGWDDVRSRAGQSRWSRHPRGRMRGRRPPPFDVVDRCIGEHPSRGLGVRRCEIKTFVDGVPAQVGRHEVKVNYCGDSHDNSQGHENDAGARSTTAFVHVIFLFICYPPFRESVASSAV